MFGSIISTLVVNAVKTTVKSSIRIDELTNKLKETCPSQQELQKIINQKNQLSQTLGLVQTNLTTLTSITNTIDKIIPPIDSTVSFIKSIPTPVAIGGFGIPMNLIIKLSDTLEKLKDLVQQGKISVKGAQQAFRIISTNITTVQNKINQLDIVVTLCAAQTGFTGSLSDGTSGITPIPTVNVTLNEELENRLSPNSTNPLNYKGWRLILQTDPNNTFSFPRRRVIAQRRPLGQSGIETLISDFGLPGSNGYSYSSDTQVLVNDIKFKIDNPNWKPGSILESIDEIEAAAEAAAAAAAEAARQAEEVKRGKVIFFGQTGAFENLPIGDFSGYDAGEYPITNNAPGMIDNGSRLISSVRVGRGMRITIFYNDFFLTKPGLSQNDSNIQNLSRKSFEHPFNAEEDYVEFYIGDEFNDHVDSFIIDKLPGGVITEFPPERLAIYEPTYALKRKSRKILVSTEDGQILQSANRYNGYVSSIAAPWGQLTDNITSNTLLFRSSLNSNPIDKIISSFPQLGQSNFITSQKEVDTLEYNEVQIQAYNTSNFSTTAINSSAINRYNAYKEFYLEQIS